MKKPTSIIWFPNSIAIFFFLLLPGISESQLDIILHEVDPGYAANHIAEDNEGNTIVCGNTFIGKLGPDSTWQWTTSIMPAEGSPGVVFILDMATDGAGNIFLTGRYSHSIQFGTITLTSLGNTEDLYVTKLDPDGNFLWAKSYGTSGGKDLGNGITLDAAGNIYITGSFFNKTCSGPNPSGLYIRDIYVAKLNNSGVAIWQKRFPPTKLQCPNGGGGSRVEVDGSGNVYTTGAFNGIIKFGNTSALTLTSLGNGDIFTVKLNSTGTPLWAKAGRGTAAENSTSLYVDNAGNAVVGGYFGAYNNGSVTFSPFTLADVDGNGTGSLGTVSNAFLVKYLANGTVAWAVNPGTMAGIHNTVNGIGGKTANEIYIALPSLGIKTISVLDGSQLSFAEMADNFFYLNGLITEKMLIRDLSPSGEDYIFSLRGICGSITMDNLALTNFYCQDCADWYTCGAPSHSDVFVIRSISPPAVNAPIMNRSVPEILGHTYLGAFNGHTYYMSDCPTAWYDALFAAEEMGGYLATITSQEEDEFLAPFAPYIDCESIYNGGDSRIGGAWIGLLTNDNDQDGNCNISSWSNGEALGYTNWSQDYQEPISGYCGPAAIIGYIGGQALNLCPSDEYRWFTNYYTNATSRYIVEFDQDPACSNPDKTYVCHNGNTICVNLSSLQSHLNHGDYAGPCGPCNVDAASIPHGLPRVERSKDTQHSFHRDSENEEVPIISPNPATNQIHIDLQHLQKEAWIRIYLSTGDKVYEHIFQNENAASIDVSSFPPGIILVEVRSGAEVWTQKVVKL